MKDTIHAIFTLEFTQTIILFLLGVAALLLEPVLLSLKIELPLAKSRLFNFFGYIFCGFAILSFSKVIFLDAYDNASKKAGIALKEAADLKKQKELIFEATAGCKPNKDNATQACPVLPILKSHDEKWEKKHGCHSA